MADGFQKMLDVCRTSCDISSVALIQRCKNNQKNQVDIKLWDSSTVSAAHNDQVTYTKNPTQLHFPVHHKNNEWTIEIQWLFYKFTKEKKAWWLQHLKYNTKTLLVNIQYIPSNIQKKADYLQTIYNVQKDHVCDLKHAKISYHFIWNICFMSK